MTPGLARLGRLLARLGVSVVYLDLAPSLRDIATAADLARRGVYQVDYAQLQGYDAYAYFKTLNHIVSEQANRLFPSQVLRRASQVLPLVADRERKLSILVREVIAGHVAPDVQLYALVDYFRRRGWRCFAWPSGRIQSIPLLSPVITWAELAVAIPVAGATALKAFASRRRRRASFRSSQDTCPPPSNQLSSARVLMFPHQGPLYGRLFRKDQYYSAKPDSLLNADRILHVELADALSDAQREQTLADYRSVNVVPVMLSTPGATGGFRRWWSACLTGWKFGLSPRAAILLEIVRSRVERGRQALQAFPSARLALLGYEHLFPVWLAYALQANGVRVAASQERLLQCYLPGWSVILDDYFVQGEASRVALSANTCASIGSVHVIGDVRLPDLMRSVPRHSGFPVGFDHATLVLDWHSDPDPLTNAQHTTSNWANNRLFYRDIVALARRFPRSCFVIRGKNVDWLTIDAFADIRRDIEASPNVVVNQDYSRLLVAQDLAIAADSVIARYTSLGDQCMAIGKPVIYHDGAANGGPLVGSVLTFTPGDLTVHNIDELTRAYACVLDQGQVLPKGDMAAMVDHYFGRRSVRETGRAEMLRALEVCLGGPTSDSPAAATSLRPMVVAAC
ncbi:MAG: hypothetical protein GC182_07095 [Rhodopseudomonas sp.]|nr:hypothetical protein [Rhodopseudomonas sp.]